MIFHSGGSLVWKKAGCVKSFDAVGWRRFLCAGKLVLGGGLSGGLCGTGGLCEGLRRCGSEGFPGGRNRNRREGYGRNKTGGVPV